MAKGVARGFLYKRPNVNAKQIREDGAKYSKKLTYGKVKNRLVLHFYYIIDHTTILNPKYLPYPFLEEQEAWQKRNHIYGIDNPDYTVLLGADVFRYGLNKTPIGEHTIPAGFRNLKYEYPLERVSDQQRKDWRTMKRRRMREWNKKLGL